MVNRVTLIGRLGKNPEVRRLENGAVVAKFSVATNESYKDSTGNWQEKTEWHNVVVWRALAERAENSLKKGALIYLEGKLSTRKWEDNGVTRYITDVVGNYFRLVSTGSSGASSAMGFPSAADEPTQSTYKSNANAAPTPPTNTAKAEDKPAVAEEVTESAGDDLPF